MDGNHFDDMVRNLNDRTSRRGALRLLAGALGALTGGQEVATLAKKKGKGKRKRKPVCATKACPTGFQLNTSTCECECTRLSCGGGLEFDSDTCRCRCPRGMRECRDRCVGANECCASDPPCPEDPKGCCHSPGVEVCTIDGCCPELNGLKACNNFCIDTTVDPHHCGDCNVACQDGEQCVDGACVPEMPCPSALSCNGVCCGEGEMCIDGVCENPFVCPRAYCSNRDLVCCPPNRFTNTAYCCPARTECRDTFVGCSSL